jgi:hypothetical protein
VRRIGILLLIVAAASGATLGASAALSPKELRASMLAAAQAQHSVHYVATSVGQARIRIVGDAGSDRGIQRISFTRFGRTGHVTVVVVRRTAYVRGDPFTLHTYMLFSAAQSSRYAGHWVSIPPSLNSAVAADVTFSSFVKSLSIKGQYSRVSGVVGGHRVQGVRTTGIEHGLRVIDFLFARVGSLPLPVEEQDLLPTKGYSSITTMSRWNERVDVHAPAHSIPAGS